MTVGSIKGSQPPLPNKDDTGDGASPGRNPDFEADAKTAIEY
jgi:hypothetical protein